MERAVRLEGGGEVDIPQRGDHNEDRHADEPELLARFGVGDHDPSPVRTGGHPVLPLTAL